MCSKLTGSFLFGYTALKTQGEHMEPEFYTVEEIAEKLRVKDFTVREWIHRKELPAYRVGREYRIKKEDYEKFLKKRRTTDTN